MSFVRQSKVSVLIHPSIQVNATELNHFFRCEHSQIYDIAIIMSSAIPDFDGLPPVEGMPQGCAWGVFDRDGKRKDPKLSHS